MEVIIYQVDAFTDTPFKGNPAGVVPDARGLSNEDMQTIAKEMNLSETAFVFPGNDDDKFEVRFFTPECEVDLCGHATIATFYTLAHKGYINGIGDGITKIFQKTKAGELAVDIYYLNGQVEKVMMYQGKSKIISLIEDYSMISKCFNIDENDIGVEGFEIIPKIISTGLHDIILPLKDRKLLDNLTINYDMISSYSRELEVTGIHVFALEFNGDHLDIWCRNFAPAVGINEESATGTANGALTYYLKDNDILKDTKLLVNQGQSLGRPSTIHCEIDCVNQEQIVKVGGKAVIVLEGVMTI